MLATNITTTANPGNRLDNLRFIAHCLFDSWHASLKAITEHSQRRELEEHSLPLITTLYKLLHHRRGFLRNQGSIARHVCPPSSVESTTLEGANREGYIGSLFPPTANPCNESVKVIDASGGDPRTSALEDFCHVTPPSLV